MIALSEGTRRVAGSRLFELLQRYDVRSMVDPFMGVPFHLNWLKRHGVAVHGGDLLEWVVRAGEGLVVNDFTILRDAEVAEIVEMLPGRIYPTDLFKGWEGVFFTEEQCIYLGVWQSNVRNLRSDGQTGLAVLGLWFVLCYWLQKAQSPDEMPDIPPSELAWHYIRYTERWVCQNLLRNTVRRADVQTTLSVNRADAAFFLPPGRNAFRKADARMWMWEAWWQGDPYLNIEHYYRETLFGARTADERAYDQALSAAIAAAEAYPIVAVQTDIRSAERYERIVKSLRPVVEIVVERDDEAYVVGRR